MEKDALKKPISLLLIGGSAGSLEVIIELLPMLKAGGNFAVIIILHRKSDDSLLARIIQGKTSWQVIEAEDKENIVKGKIYVAPADYHLLVEKDHCISLDFSEKINYSRPSIDVSFETAAEAYGPSVAAILLSGANADGTEGMGKIKAAGGLTIAQHPEDASVDFMPLAAIKAGYAGRIMRTEELKKWISELNYQTLRGQESP